MHFTGKFTYMLDERNRVPIPPAFRAAFDTGAYITTGGSDPCLVLHTPDSMAKTAAIIEAIPEETDLGEQARRDFFGNLQPIKKDPQGRITVPVELIEHAGLKKEVLVVGTGRRMEIWEKATYDAGEEDRKRARRLAMDARSVTPKEE